MAHRRTTVHVIQHTHWDLEWYFTANESFVQLAYHMDEVMSALETDRISHYLLDGQMSILDDYLTCFPEQRERLRGLVADGRLQIGPWYTQTDELIVRGESMLRNLNLGMKLADSLGGCMYVGYLPDSFGQSKDMPKIYRGFGIDRTVFWRGVPADKTEKREFYWCAEDGSRVMAAHIRDGYFVGVGLIYTDDCRSLTDSISEGATGRDLLLPVGGDQRKVDFDLRKRIDLYDRALETIDFKESTYDQFFEAIAENDLPEIEGELISGSVSKIHRSIYSSRYDHKYLGDKVERRMIYQVEPLMVMAEQCGVPYKQGVLDRIWKLLSRNQAHDSAGGCNSDRTNAIILNRYVEADQLSYSLVDYLTRKIAESRRGSGEGEIVFFNTLPWRTKKVVSCEVSTLFAGISIVKDGHPVPFEVIGSRKEGTASIRRGQAAIDQGKFYYVHRVVLESEIPSMGFAAYQVLEAHKTTERADAGPDAFAGSTPDGVIENECYRISCQDGALDLLDKRTGTSYADVLSFEDGGDEGDTYDYSPPYDDDIYRLNLSGASCRTHRGKLSSRLEFDGDWKIAADLIERGKRRRTRSVPYRLEVELLKSSTQIRFHLNIDNRASDHRMRALIRTPHANFHSYADTPFGTIRRDVEDPHISDWREIGWKEEPTAIFPMLTYVNSHTEASSWTVFSKGIKEYQLIGRDHETIGLTLFRSVGYLGRPDLLRRPGIASGNEYRYIPTPDSQLKRELPFKFALQLDSDYHPAKLAKDYLLYALSCPYYQNQELNRFTTTLKYFGSNLLEGRVELQESICLSSENLAFSALLKTADAKGFDIRVYNPDACKTVDGGTIRGTREMNACFVDFKGAPVSDPVRCDVFPLGAFKPGEIKTIHIVD